MSTKMTVGVGTEGGKPFIPQYIKNTYKSANLFNFGELYWNGMKKINAGN